MTTSQQEDLKPLSMLEADEPLSLGTLGLGSSDWDMTGGGGGRGVESKQCVGGGMYGGGGSGDSLLEEDSDEHMSSTGGGGGGRGDRGAGLE